jgi:hypothetical protein
MIWPEKYNKFHKPPDFDETLFKSLKIIWQLVSIHEIKLPNDQRVA